MFHVVRLWWPILLAVTLLQIGNGLSATLFSLSVDARGMSAWQTGLILSAFYAGSVAGPFIAPPMIRLVRHVGAFAIFAGVAAWSVAGLGFTNDPLILCVLRAGQGIGFAAFYAVVESWLNLGTDDRWRARVFAVYIMMQLGGLVAGQLLINARDAGEQLLFLLAGGLMGSLVAIPALAGLKSPSFSTPKSMGVFAVFARSPLGVTAVILAGFTWASLMATGPAYAQRIGLDNFTTSMFMALAIASGVLAQFPLGRWADSSNRRLVLACMGFGGALATLAGAMAPPGVEILAAIAAFGAMTLPLYAVAVALTNESLAQDERIASSAAMVIFFGVGAVAGPSAITFAMDALGPVGFFVTQGAALTAFALAAARSWSRRRVQVAS